MAEPLAPGAINVNPLSGSERIALETHGPQCAQATAKQIAGVGGAVTAQTGTAYTFAASDVGGYTRFTNGSAVTLTVAADANVPMPADAVLTAEQSGAGVVTVTAAGGVTINSSGSMVATNGQFAVVSLKRTALNVWTLFGNLA